MFIVGLVIGATPASSSSEEWTLIEERGVKAYPNLREYVWQKNTSAPPHGPYDKIGLHRLVKTGIEPQGVFFLLPGTWMNGEQLVSNPPEDNWTAYEDNSIPLYLANRGFDVYAIDYRTHFVDQYLDPENLSFMLDWGWDQWISDIKEAVELAKEVSGAERIYLAGESFGGVAAANYASLYWIEELEGIILLDGGTAAKDPEGVNNAYNLTAKIEEMNATGTWSWEFGGEEYSGVIFLMQYAEEHPDAPAEYPPGHPLEGQPLPPDFGWDNITEWAAFAIYMAWGAGGVSNIYGGYGNTSVIIHTLATSDRYWPTRLNLESAAIADWDNCPYVTYDFDDHYCEIDVPLLGFLSEFGLNAFGSFRHGIANPDFTGIVLEGYGHLDVYVGNYIREDVNEPTYQWLMGARLLTVTSSPMTGIAFTINGIPETTPYTEWLPQGSYTLEMPAGHNGYIWSHWLEDEDTSRIKTITLPGTTWTAVYTQPSTVGGKATPINTPTIKPESQTPWIWLTTIILSLVATVVYVKKRKRHTEINY